MCELTKVNKFESDLKKILFGKNLLKLLKFSSNILKQEAPVEAEVATTPKNVRKRKTTHNDPSYGSFFLRVGAIGEFLLLSVRFNEREEF